MYQPCSWSVYLVRPFPWSLLIFCYITGCLESLTSVPESVLIVDSSVIGCVLPVVSRVTIDFGIIVFPTVPASTVSCTAPEFLRIVVVCPVLFMQCFLTSF